MNPQLQELKELITLLNRGVSKEDFVASFKAAIKQITALEKVLIERNNKLSRETKTDIQKAIKDATARLDTLFEEHRAGMNMLHDKVKALKHGKDGKTPVKGVDYFDGVDGHTPTKEELMALMPKPMEHSAEMMRDKMESIKEEKEKLAIKAIGYLEERLDKLEKRPMGKGGGGVSAMGVAQAFKYIAHTEEPVGDIDGANLTYTVKNSIWWIAGFTLNGEQIAELPNYTFSGRTITFASALPAAYSGKDWEIKYIGT